MLVLSIGIIQCSIAQDTYLLMVNDSFRSIRRNNNKSSCMSEPTGYFIQKSLDRLNSLWQNQKFNTELVIMLLLLLFCRVWFLIPASVVPHSVVLVSDPVFKLSFFTVLPTLCLCERTPGFFLCFQSVDPLLASSLNTVACCIDCINL